VSDSVPRILVLHGPNLNLLGTRQPEIYGSITLAQIDERLTVEADRFGAELRAFQSNHEGALIDALHDARGWATGAVVNAGAYSHTSYALRDGIAATAIPTIEVHISNVHARERFRHRSVLTPVCRGAVVGLGWRGYLLALRALLEDEAPMGAR
jgi:3-dehydroquinate dehydratase-2